MRRVVCRDWRKVYDIGEQNRRGAEFFGDGFIALFQFFGDPFRQNVIQELICLIALRLNRVFLNKFPASVTFQCITCEHANDVCTQEEKIMHDKNDKPGLCFKSLEENDIAVLIANQDEDICQYCIAETKT